MIFKHACHANPGADKKWAGSSLYISIHLFLKFSNTSVSENIQINHIEHINHDIHQNVLFQMFLILF